MNKVCVMAALLALVTMISLMGSAAAYDQRYNHWSTVYGDIGGNWASWTLLMPHEFLESTNFHNDYPTFMSVLAGRMAIDVSCQPLLSMARPWNKDSIVIQLGCEGVLSKYLVIEINPHEDFGTNHVHVFFSIDGVNPIADEFLWERSFKNGQEFPYKYTFRLETAVSPMPDFEGSGDYSTIYAFRIERLDGATGEIVEVLMTHNSVGGLTVNRQPTYFYAVAANFGVWADGNLVVNAAMFDNKVGAHSDTCASDYLCNMRDVQAAILHFNHRALDSYEDYYWNNICWTQDVNVDGIVNMRDISYLINHQGFP